MAKKWYLALLIWLCATPIAALACGMPLNARIPAEQALILHNQGQQEIIASFALDSDAPNAAVIFPVPSIPTVSEGPSQELFTFLERVTRPTEIIEEKFIWRNEDGLTAGSAPGVSVYGQETIGSYEVARLGATDANELWQWLEQNGYQAPEEALPIIESYVADAWSFVAIRLGDQEIDGELKPLRISFESEEIVYPTRFGSVADEARNMRFYVLSDSRLELSQIETVYAGPVEQLDENIPLEFIEYFQLPYLTVFADNYIRQNLLGDDLHFRPAASNAPYRKEVTKVVIVDGWSRMTFPLFGLALVMLSTSMAMGIAFNIRRQIDRIAGPDPELEEDD